MAVFVGFSIWAYAPSFTLSSTKAPASGVAANASLRESLTLHPDFHVMPLEKKIEAASVIAIAKYETVGERNKCVLSEILKQTPGTKFYYKVGDELQHCSHDIKPNQTRGDGQVVFFVGSPADFRFSTSIYGDRVGGLGNMPVDLLRKQITELAPK